MLPTRTVVALFALTASTMFSASRASADVLDTAWGRLDGDVALSGGLGGGITRFDSPLGLLVGELRARVLDTAGFVAAVDAAPSGSARLVFGVDMRPLFLPRFILGGSGRNGFADLLVDSIGIDLGVAVGPLDGTPRVGTALMLGGGLDVPVYWWHSGRVAIRIGVRWIDAAPTNRGATPAGGSEVSVFAALTFVLMARSGLATYE